ncbi:glycosyltransferase [Nostoc sp. UHCC 0702]|nr:glycosyltransferase [Nostoc sp. UHCC 0702]
MKTKLAFIIRSLKYGGAETQLVNLAKGLEQQGFDVSVFYFYPNGSLVKDLQESKISTICLEKQGRWHIFSFFWHLVRHLKQIHPDILHGYLGVPNLLTILLKPFFPSTRMIWGIRNSHHAPNQFGWLGNVVFQLECLFSHFTDLIVVNSHAGKAYCLTHGFPADKMIVISNGIDTEKFQPDREARAKVRTEWGISENTILIGLVGRLDPRKDHPTFIKAAALLYKQRQNVHFVCVGSGSESYTRELHDLANELGISEKVIWAGAHTDMPAIYNSLDIAVSSSYTEGFPNVIGEAMACGVPCVVTDVGDSAWIVGDRSMVVPPRNPEALKTAIQQLIEKLETNSCNSVHIRHRIVEQFSIHQLVVKTKTTFLEISHEYQYQ